MSVIWYPVSRIVRAFLIQEGVGFSYDPSTDWSVATEASVDSPIKLITIFDESAQKKSRTVDGVHEDPVVSIEVRSGQPEHGQYKAKEIQDALDGLSMWTWDGDSDQYGQTVVIANARRSRGIFNLGRDENGRWRRNLEYALVIQSVQ